jgi:hypothetical protein
MQRLLVSVRGPLEAIAAARGGAHIADVEYPASALGTPYPLNIKAVRDQLQQERLTRVLVSTNIGEEQPLRSTACQAALGVAAAGADLIKFGLAGLPIESCIYLGRNVVRTVRAWEPSRRLYPTLFVDDDLREVLDPLANGPRLVKETDADGMLIDTFNKNIGKGLLDYLTLGELEALVRALRDDGKETWVAGSITLEELPPLWEIGVDVICVRGAACQSPKGQGRFGAVSEKRVRELVLTIP